MASSRRLSIEERQKVVCEYDRLKNYRQVAKLFKISVKGVRKIIKKSIETRTLADRPRSGRPRVTTTQENLLIVRLCKKNPEILVKEIQEQLQNAGSMVSQTTIRRRLHDAKLRGYVARKKPLLSNVHKKRRLEFALKYENKSLDFWKKVIFSDESKFEVYGNNRRKTIWRSNSDNPYDKKYLRPTVKYGGGRVIVWGCFSWFGTGQLHVINNIMTAHVYCDILRNNLLKSARAMGLNQDFIFQQDNDPKHSAKITMQYLKKNKIKLLDWPSMSPDLNPIENLWDEIKRRIPSTSRRNVAMLENEILNVWLNMPKRILQKLVESMPRRLRAVIQNNGGHTKY